MQSEAGNSETSYATSAGEEDIENERRVPDPPTESANGTPFNCPYCYTIQRIKHFRNWK